MGGGKAHVDQHVVLCRVHKGRRFLDFGAELIGYPAPLRGRGVRCVRSQGGVHESGYDASRSLSGVGERIGREMHSEALPGARQHLGDDGLDALMRVAD